ncbi:MAG: UDP-N-acetylmuramoyl-L-alanine--D-glutamate ligase, partial [Carbonactinosporaceae bacterium]
CAGVPVLGEVELAWRLRRAGGRTASPAPWLAVTGTNGKTTTVRMLAAILEAAGYRAAVAGNVGTPLLDVVLADPPYDVIAVELSSFQLHWSDSVEPEAAAVLNIAPDHVDWHGSLEAYAADKARIYRGTATAVFNADDAGARAIVPDQARTVGFTLGSPETGQLGMAGDRLVDRAFGDGDGGVVLARAEDVCPHAPHNLSNALAAAALARSHGVPARAVAAGLRAFRPDPHRITHVATVGGVAYVDDSKATNPHAAAASLAAYPSVVWVAGGLAKGAAFEDLIADAGPRIRAAVLIGADRAVIREAFARHAPEVPVVEFSEADTGVMDRAVVEAARRAKPGDTVLLAPGCASWDIFPNYGERGDRFAEAVHRLVSPRG